MSAHRRDEFLQAARIGLEPHRVHVELNLTPGIALAEAIIRDIDANGDGLFSVAEQQHYIRRALDGLVLRIDDSRSLRLAPLRSAFPSAMEMRSGEAAIALRLAADLPRLGIGAHRLQFRNENARSGGVFLANTLVPDGDDLVVTAQRRDVDQRELVVEFTVRKAPAPSHSWMWVGLAMGLGLLAALGRQTRVVRENA